MRSLVPLTTPRLSLVALCLEHAPAVLAYASDPEISSMIARPGHETIAAVRRMIAEAMVGYAQGTHYQWGLVRRTDLAFIGASGFGEIGVARRVAELNYVLARPYWGYGYATEAAAAILQFGFAQMGLHIVEARAFPENKPSLGVMAKLGLRYRETTAINEQSGSQRDVSVWQIERERWNVGAAERVVRS